MSERRYKISKNQLEYYIHCKRTVDEISKIINCSHNCVNRYIKEYNLEAYHECIICREDDFYELKSQIIRNQSGAYVYAVFDICETCYSNKLREGQILAHLNNHENIMLKSVETSLKNNGVRYAFHKESRIQTLKAQKEESNKKKQEKHYELFPYTSKEVFIKEYITNNKSLYALCKEWNCIESVILKYLRLHGLEERYSCESCGNIENLILKKGKNVLKYKPLCVSCRSLLNSNAQKEYQNKLDIEYGLTKEVLEMLHIDRKLSKNQIGAELNVGSKKVNSLFKKFNIIEIKRCEKCGAEDNLFESKTPRGNKIIHNYCNKCHSDACSTASGGGNVGCVSKISQKLFWEIYYLLPKELKGNCFFSELNKEYVEKLNERSRESLEIESRRFIYDFTIVYKDIKFVVEFNGDIFHANPEIYKAEDTPHPFVKNITALQIWKKDEKRRDYCFDAINGFMLEVWENDYNTKKQEVIDKIIMNINMVYYENENKNLRSFNDVS